MDLYLVWIKTKGHKTEDLEIVFNQVSDFNLRIGKFIFQSK